MTDKSRIAAVGAGRMGRGIAHVFAYAGHPVDLVDLKERDAGATAALAADAMADIRSNLLSLLSLGVLDETDLETILARIRFVPRQEAADALAHTRVAFEGVPETLEAKREALALIGEAVPADAIVTSTTSTLLVDTLAGSVRRPERFLNAHWLNPAYLIPLVELSPHSGTSPDVVAELKALLEEVGKVPVLCRASPGYIVPRIQMLAMNEAARLVEEGVATAEDVDKATRFGFGFRFAILGLVEFIDWGGGDILYYASRYMREAMADDRFAAPAIVDENMRKGHIGMKTGQGFYDFRDQDVDAYRREKLALLVGLLRHMGLQRPPHRDTNNVEAPGRE